jgi:hypothetical protein
LALAVPLSRFTSRVGGGSAFYVRPLRTYEKITEHIFHGAAFCVLHFDLVLARERPSGFIFRTLDACEHHLSRLGFLHSAQFADICLELRRRWHGAVRLGFDFAVADTSQDTLVMIDQWPNKSPEPTAVGAGSSAIAVHVASRRWLIFLR